MKYLIWTRGEPPQRSLRVKDNDEKEKSPVDLALEESIQTNDREQINDKINGRYLVKQTGQNPFLMGSYVDDIGVQEQFLRPKSSHAEKNNLLK
jgi:hypothetical protein